MKPPPKLLPLAPPKTPKRGMWGVLIMPVTIETISGFTLTRAWVLIRDGKVADVYPWHPRDPRFRAEMCKPSLN